MKKFLFLFSVLFVCALNVYSYDGALSDDSKLKVVKTKYFDVIYPPESKEAAAIIVEKGDALYEEIAAFYNLPKPFRIPVSISHGFQVFNAYFSFAPLNHIVMYDTQPGEGMEVFSETFYNTFKHELTHAITLNLHNGFWRGLKNVLGNTWNGGALVDTTFMMEGSAVETESKAGEGRMNDDYSLHLVKQAKIEGQFPRFTEVQGAISIYPGKTQCYIFGGAFWTWIVKKYGQEKFAAYWYKCNNLLTLTYFMAFKSVFGVSMKDAWAQFVEEFEVPDVKADPYENEGFESFGSRNYKGNVKNLAICDSGIGFFDTDGVYFWKKGSDTRKASKILNNSNVSKINFSKDGRFLAVSYYSNLSNNPKYKVLVYDLKKKSVHYLNDNGYREAGVFEKDGKYYLFAEKTGGKNFASARTPVSMLFEIKQKSKDGRIKGFEKVWERSNGFENTVTSEADGGNGRIYYVIKNGLTYSIWSLGGENWEAKKEMDFPEGMRVRNLSGIDSEKNFAFSYTMPGQMPRLGKVKLGESSGGEISLMKQDVSGGIFAPVINDSKVVYVAEFYRGSQLVQADLSKIDFEKVAAENKRSEESVVKAPDLSVLDGARNFGAGDFFRKGTIVPVFSLASSSRITKDGDGVETCGLPLGFTYISSSPWTQPLYGISGAYDLMSNSGLVKAGLMGQKGSDIFSYSAYATAEFDDKGYKQAYVNGTLKSVLEIGGNWYFKINDAPEVFEGRQNLWENKKSVKSLFDNFEVLKNPDDTQRFFARNVFSFGLGNIASVGPGTYENGGIQLMSNYENYYSTEIESFTDGEFYQNIGFDLLAKIPRILPLRDKATKYTYNLPLTLQAALFPTSTYFAYAMASAVLFSVEIQETTNFLPFNLLFFNRFTLEASYLAKFKSREIGSWAIANLNDYFEDISNGDMNYSDKLSLTGKFIFCPNIGGMASASYAITLSGSLNFRFNRNDGDKFWDLGIGFGMNLF